MELRTHVQILKQARWFIVLFTLLCGVAALLFVVFRPVQYKAVVSFDVQFVNRPQTQDYQYGTYYDLKAAEIYTQNLMSWFMTPAVVEEIYTTAGVPYTIDSIDQFTNRFQTKQYSPQNFAVVFTDYDQNTAQKLSEAIARIIEERSGGAVQINDKAVFAVHALPPVIAQDHINVGLAVAVGIIAGFIMSVVLIYIREYFRE